MPSGWHIQEHCPQCGAPVTLEETDRILACSFCRIRLYLSSPDYCRYLLAAPEALSDDLIFAPYWRFRGMVFSCRAGQVDCRVIDTSLLSARCGFMPPSLGLRPQALSLRFASPQTRGRFLRQDVQVQDIFPHIGSLPEPVSKEFQDAVVYHRVFIGEVVSLIYAPYAWKDNALYDAITQRPVKKVNHGALDEVFAFEAQELPGITCTTMLCPQCGWDLSGEQHSCVLFCGNCETAWAASPSGFRKVAYGICTGRHGDGLMYVPFWRLRAAVEGARLSSYADLIRFANLSRIASAADDRRDLYFWTPAFRIMPQVFLKLAKQLTILQPDEALDTKTTGRQLYPVTLSLAEACQSITVIIGAVAIDKKRVFPVLSELQVSLQADCLVYIPFAQRGTELVHERLPLGISRTALEMGKKI